MHLHCCVACPNSFHLHSQEVVTATLSHLSIQVVPAHRFGSDEMYRNPDVSWSPLTATWNFLPSSSSHFPRDGSSMLCAGDVLDTSESLVSASFVVFLLGAIGVRCLRCKAEAFGFSSGGFLSIFPHVVRASRHRVRGVRRRIQAISRQAIEPCLLVEWVVLLSIFCLRYEEMLWGLRRV